jgi:predicted TIM-barrel fold metal-dependent hydrolase
MIAGFAGAGTLALLPSNLAHAQAAGVPPRIIDVHHHLCPPAYLAEISKTQPPLQKVLLDWTPARSIEDMDRAGVATSILSLTTPGLWFGNVEQSRRLARICNEYAAGLVAAYPKRFGFFATLPLPDTEGSLAEIAYAMDTLKADGVGLFTSYGTKYLGDPSFHPVLEELNRRKALVCTHPTINQCCVNIVPDVAEAIIEYGTDTTRTIANLVFSGTTTKFPDIGFLFSHAGGTMPFLIERFIAQAKAPHLAARLPRGVLSELKRFYYDTAQSSNPAAMGALKQLVATSQILFGTDFPYRTAEDHVKGLARCGFTAAEMAAIERENATRLLPRLRA